MILVCPECKKEFPKKASTAKPGSSCSRDCSARRRYKKVDLICANKACGVPFTRPPYRVHKNPEDSTCSRKCATAHMRDRGLHRQPFRRVHVIPAVVEAEPAPIPHCVDYEDVPLGA
jgi:hypothetical protein